MQSMRLQTYNMNIRMREQPAVLLRYTLRLRVDKPDDAAIVEADADCADGIADALGDDLLHVGAVLDNTATLLKPSC